MRNSQSMCQFSLCLVMRQPDGASAPIRRALLCLAPLARRAGLTGVTRDLLRLEQASHAAKPRGLAFLVIRHRSPYTYIYGARTEAPRRRDSDWLRVRGLNLVLASGPRCVPCAACSRSG